MKCNHIMTDAEPLQQMSLLSIDQALQQAIAHHHAGQLQEAERLYRAILKAQPHHLDAIANLEAVAMQVNLVALYTDGRFIEAAAAVQTMVERFPLNGFGWVMLGMLSKQMGESTDGLAYARKGVALWPNYAAAHSNLGTILMELGLQNEAEVSYWRAVKLKPDFAEAHNNLGDVYFRLGRPDKAEDSCRRALQIKPDNAKVYNNLGHILYSLNRLDEAEASCRRALQIKPDYANAYGTLGEVLRDQGKLDEALACFQQKARLMPGDDAVQHQIASMIGKNTERAPVQYIEKVFDDYADRFDTHLQQVLKYEVPEKLVSLITGHVALPVEKWDVLDMGCGTGLVGLAIAPFARQLTGVDLSAKMLGKARARNIYQRLERLDILTMMRGEKTSSYDVVVAADVFIYLGRLDEIVSEIKRLLRPSGVFAFSIEALEMVPSREVKQDAQREYQLENTGRYTHSVDYITRLASNNGFLAKEMLTTQIRLEHGEPVNGHLVLWGGAPQAA